MPVMPPKKSTKKNNQKASGETQEDIWDSFYDANLAERESIESQCRSMWERTTDEQKKKWTSGQTREIGQKALTRKRPLITPDEVFGPAHDGATYATWANYVEKPEVSWFTRGYPESTLVASFISRRWAHVIFDPWRSEREIVQDVKKAIKCLRSSARDRYARRMLGAKTRSPQDPAVAEPGVLEKQIKKGKRPAHRYSDLIGAWCYYCRLSGDSREEAAAYVFGKKDEAAMKRVDKAIEAFISHFCPGDRWEPWELPSDD